MLCALVLALLTAVAPGAVGTSVDPPIRVEILSLLQPQRLTIQAPDESLILPQATIRLPAGRGLVVGRDGPLVSARTPNGGRWRGNRLVVGEAETRFLLTIQGRKTLSRGVRGQLSVESNGKWLRIVVETDMETLVASGVAAELSQVPEPAALEAGSIAIRSYIAANRGRHEAEGFDLCDTTHCLFSQGLLDGTNVDARAAISATEATRGRILERDGRIVAGYMTGMSRGSTTTPSEMWGGDDRGDFERVACALCSASPFYTWRRSLDVSDVARALDGVVGWTVRGDVDFVLDKDADGWVRWVAIRSSGHVRRMRGDAFRMAVERRLGWNTIPSPRFSIERAGHRLRIVGGGFGHGIGLCVAGAAERARGGASSQEILNAYFPRATTRLLTASELR